MHGQPCGGTCALLRGRASIYIIGLGSSVPDALVTQAMTGAEQAADRARRALRLLCEERKSGGGYLYLFAETGLTHVASLGDCDPPEGLLSFLNERFERDQDDLVTMTVAAMAENEAGDDSATFIDKTGVFHEPVMLTCVLDGEPKHAGIAALTHREMPVRMPISPLVSAVSAHLIRAGDTRGVGEG